MRRVVVTGMGIVSSIGNNTQEVLASLREAIQLAPEPSWSRVAYAGDHGPLGF